MIEKQDILDVINEPDTKSVAVEAHEMNQSIDIDIFCEDNDLEYVTNVIDGVITHKFRRNK